MGKRIFFYLVFILLNSLVHYVVGYLVVVSLVWFYSSTPSRKYLFSLLTSGGLETLGRTEFEFISDTTNSCGPSNEFSRVFIGFRSFRL